MQKGELNLITGGLAKRMEISGKATADERNHNLRIEKGKKLRCLACSTLIGFAILFHPAVRACTPNQDSDLHGGREDNTKKRTAYHVHGRKYSYRQRCDRD